MNNKEKTTQDILQETQQVLEVLVREQEEIIGRLKIRLGEVSSA